MEETDNYNIQARELTLRNLLTNTQEVYIIPKYQRAYAWEEKHWNDLLEDINNIKSGMHFFGSIVVVPNKHSPGINKLELVDGQQRITTILIILSIVRDLYNRDNKTDVSKFLEENFLFASDLKDNKKILVPKLELSAIDNVVFINILNGDFNSTEESPHPLIKCYNYFKNEIEGSYEDIWKKILDGFSIVHISVNNHLNAFKLFETLNDRGLELSAYDLIKNFILMKASENQLDFKDAAETFDEIYSKIRDKEPVKFIRWYLLSEYEGKISETRIYEKIKNLVDIKNVDIIEFCNDIKEKAGVYQKIIDKEFESNKINLLLKSLEVIQANPSYSLLIKLLSYFEDKKIGEKELIAILNFIALFHIRWGICGLPTNKLDPLYNRISITLPKIPESKDYKEVIRQLFNELQRNAGDIKFSSEFGSREFNPSEPRTKYILWKLSNPTGETILNEDEIQTEHIMPQKLSSEWILYLKDDENKIKDLHAKKLNNIGNLTIMKDTWNESNSNKLFEQKKNYYKQSEFTITKDLNTFKKWDFEEIEKRQQELSLLASKIWSISKTKELYHLEDTNKSEKNISKIETTESSHLIGADKLVLSIYEKIKSAMSSLDKEIIFNPQKYYISIRKTKNFAFIYISKHKLNIVFMLQLGEGKELVKKQKLKELGPGPQKFYHYEHCFETDVKNEENLDEVLKLLSEAYKKSK